MFAFAFMFPGARHSDIIVDYRGVVGVAVVLLGDLAAVSHGVSDQAENYTEHV